MSGRRLAGGIQKRKGVSLVPRALEVWRVPEGFVAEAVNNRIWIAPSTKKRIPEQFLVARESGIELMTLGKHRDHVVITRYFDAKDFTPTSGLPPEKTAR
jgi:hypothetical protein